MWSRKNETRRDLAGRSAPGTPTPGSAWRSGLSVVTGRRRQDWVGAPGRTELVWQRGAVDSPGERYTSGRRAMEYAFEANGALRLTEP